MSHLAAPYVDGEVDKLRVFPHKVLNGLHFKVVRRLFLHDQTKAQKQMWKNKQTLETIQERNFKLNINLMPYWVNMYSKQYQVCFNFIQ